MVCLLFFIIFVLIVNLKQQEIHRDPQSFTVHAHARTLSERVERQVSDLRGDGRQVLLSHLDRRSLDVAPPLHPNMHRR